MGDSISSVFLKSVSSVAAFLPNLIISVLVFLIGIIVASIIRNILYTGFYFLKLDSLFDRLKLMRRTELRVWTGIVAEIVRWSIILFFIPPIFESLGLSHAMNSFTLLLTYIPNIFAAVLILFAGIAFSNLVSESVKQAVGITNEKASSSAAVTTKTIILFIAGLIALSQLGVAQDFIRIFFIGLVGMIALAGGLSFGLGGKEFASEILRFIQKKLLK